MAKSELQPVTFSQNGVTSFTMYQVFDVISRRTLKYAAPPRNGRFLYLTTSVK